MSQTNNIGQPAKVESPRRTLRGLFYSIYKLALPDSCAAHSRRTLYLLCAQYLPLSALVPSTRPGKRRCALRLRRTRLHTKIVNRIVNVPSIEMRVLAHELAGRHHLVHDELRMVRREFQLFFFSDLVHNGIKRLVRQLNAFSRALSFEDLAVKADRRRTDLDLVREPPQKRGIHQVFRFQVG